MNKQIEYQKHINLVYQEKVCHLCSWFDNDSEMCTFPESNNIQFKNEKIKNFTILEPSNMVCDNYE